MNLNMLKCSEKKRSAIIPFLFFGIIFILNGCASSEDYDVQAKIDSIGVRLVPDKREGVYEITAEVAKDGTIILHGETTVPQAGNEIIKTLGKQGIELIDSIILLPDTIINSYCKGLVSLSVINLRKNPDHRSELVSQSILGTPVLILKSENSWVLIQTPDNYIAWTEKSSVNSVTSSQMSEWKRENKVIYKMNSGLVYTSPDETSVVGDLVAGSILVKREELRDHLKVILPDDREGLVRKKDVTDFDLWKKAVNCSEENICTEALTFIGSPYLWGGSSTKAVDCSGFVQSVYFMNGFILSRDASLQALHGIEVDISDGFSRLKKGDLLFFGSKDTTGVRITHVAIYKGDTEYIHSSGRVMINSLDSARTNFSVSRLNSLLIAKRIIGSENDIGIVPVYKHPWY